MADNPEKTGLPLDTAVMRMDTRLHGFDMREIRNRRFMYNPQTGTLILGRQYARNGMAVSHAEEHAQSAAAEPFDSFIRGWVGTSRQYPHGVIHFAPPVDARHMETFNSAFDTLLMFSGNHAGGKTVIRGFGADWEQPLSAILDTAPITQKESEDISMEYYGIWAVRGPGSVMGAAEAWSKRDGIPEVFTAKEDADRQAARYNESASSPHVRYSVRGMEPEVARNLLRQRDMACAKAIDTAISESYMGDYRYDLPAAADKIIGEWGAEQVDKVLVNVLLMNDWDGRFSPAHIEWARGLGVEPDQRVYCDTHPAILNGFTAQVRKKALELEQAGHAPEKVGNYTITRSIQFDNDRGFAYGENPGAPAPFATWQFTSEDGKRDHYWGHYHSRQEDALKDYENRVNEYMADYPSLSVVVNPLAAAEMSMEQNYNQIDGVLNNMEPRRADLTDGQTLEEIKELAPETLAVEDAPEVKQSPPPKGRKFENVDVIAALGAVVAKNTVSYKTDFEYDKESFVKAAESRSPEDRHFLWLSRQNGTECFHEREIFIASTEAHNNWTYYEGRQAELVPFVVEITGMEDGKVMGNLYELDHAQNVGQIKTDAIPRESVLLTFKDGEQKRFAHDEYTGHFQQIQQAHGRITDVRHEVADESALQAVLDRQRDTRARFPARSFDAFVKKLPQRERPSVMDKLDAAKKTVKPPAADKKPPAKSGPEL